MDTTMEETVLTVEEIEAARAARFKEAQAQAERARVTAALTADVVSDTASNVRAGIDRSVAPEYAERFDAAARRLTLRIAMQPPLDDGYLGDVRNIGPVFVVRRAHSGSRTPRSRRLVAAGSRSAGGGSSDRPRSSDDDPAPLGASFATHAVSTPSRSEGGANARAGSQILFGISFAGCVEAVRAGVTTSFAPARTRPSAVIA